MDTTDRRLIEDYLPIESISDESRVENSVTQARGHLSKALLSILHRWWARRPLSACRAAVFGALVPAPRDEAERKELIEQVTRLCRWKAPPKEFEAARKRILEANGGKPPKVLDMFAGGGSIPLEAARLGCEAYALELNPVAHLVELATLVYPARFGQRLVDEVRRWSQWVCDRAKAEVGDLYPSIPDPEARPPQGQLGASDAERPMLTPVAYLWTRTVPCRQCGAEVPLHRQTWLRKKAKGFVALQPVADAGAKQVRYERLTSSAEKPEHAIAEWQFDPGDLSSRGEAACQFCAAVASNDYVKEHGNASGLGVHLMAIVCTRQGERGKVYLGEASSDRYVPVESDMQARLDELLKDTGLTLPTERIFCGDTRAFFSHLYGMKTFADHFTTRQLLTLLTFVRHVRAAHKEMLGEGMDSELAKAVATYLAFIVDKVAERGANVCRWDNTHEKIQSPIANGKMPMMWDFPEVNPFGGGSGSWEQSEGDVADALVDLADAAAGPSNVVRGSALSLPYEDGFFDAIITDPPYYDNVPYAYLADFFHVWLRRVLEQLYPEHLSLPSSPTKAEAVMDPSRHDGNKDQAREAYESMMEQAFAEARRVLKPGAPMACVYAHKTTAGWAALVDAMRRSGFVVTEAWPIDTENPSRQRQQESAALASSVFLVARRREEQRTGSYENDVLPELREIVHERVETLWELGISGADLVIAAVGAGLRAYTRFERAEYANGEEVPAERFLREVEGVVLETLLEKIFGVPGAGMSVVDGPSGFYVLWRYAYKTAPLEAGEAIVFTYGQPVELDGPRGLSTGARTLVEKKKGVYRLLDSADRGADEKLGLPDDGERAPLIDVLHRSLYLMEYQPGALSAYLAEANPDRERLRLLANVLARPGLKGGEGDRDRMVVTTQREQAALGKLVANWRSLVDARVPTPQERAGQARLL